MAVTNPLLATILYSDIFNFPLTREELYKYFLYKKITLSELDEMIKKNKKYLVQKNRLYTLKKKGGNISKRLENAKIFNIQITLAQKMAKIISYIPTVQFVGLSGSVAMENSSIGDDIDFFIITSSGLLWLTRLFVVLLLFFIGKKRNRNTSNAQNMICPNMFIDSISMTLPFPKQNIYTAHEIIQMRPLVNKNNTYEAFLFANNWIKRYFKNVPIKDGSLHSNPPNTYFRLAEKIAKLIQLQYMHSHRTTELITTNLLAFHPQDTQSFVLQEFTHKLHAYGIQV